MSDVFISYSRQHSDFVHQLHDALAQLQQEVWVDWADILLTADWWREICAGIEATHTFVFVITPESIASPICHLEIDYALQNNKRLVPVVRAETDEKAAFESLASRELDDNILNTLAGRNMLTIAHDNWQALARHNWLFFNEDSDFDDNFQQLINAINTDLEQVKLHTRLLVRAREWDNHGRNKSFLLTGDALRESEGWLASASSESLRPTNLQLNYVTTSQQNSRKRQRILFIATTIALALTIGLSALSINMFGQAITSLKYSQSTRRALRAEMTEIVATHTAFVAEILANPDLLYTPEAQNP